MKTMKHMSKRALSLFLALTMCLGMLNLTVFAAEDEEGLVYTCGKEAHVHSIEDGCYILVCTEGDDSEEAETEPGEPEDTDDQDAVADDEESKDDESEDNDSEEAETKPGESEDADTTDDESEDNDSEEAETKPGESEDADTTDDKSEDNDSEEAETKPGESEDADTTDDESEDNDTEEAETEPGEPEDADTTDDESEDVDSQDTDSESTDSQETDSQDTASEADESNQSGTDAVSDSSTSTDPEPASSSTEQIEDTEMLASLGFLVLYGSVSDTEDEADEPDVPESSEAHVHSIEAGCYELVCGKEAHIHDETCTAPKVTIETNLPSLSLTNSSDPVTLKLLEAPYVTVTKVNISDVQLEVSVTRQLGGQRETVTLGEGSTLTVTYQDVNATYEVNYTAYDGENQVLATAKATFSVADYNKIPDKMEGDEAYISSAGLTNNTDGYKGKYLLTGTKPFDSTSGNGYDQGQDDLYVRTYDTVSYQVTYSTQMQADAQTTNVGSGRVCYELVLPVDATKATFDLGGSAWIQTNAEAAYKQETITLDGKQVQVIRGSFLMQAGSEGGAAIGSSYQTLTIGIRVLNMKNGQTLQPEFTFWLEGNQVAENCQYETVTANNGAQVNIPSGPLVTGSGYVCPSHNHQEFQTVKPEAVIISARPMYNLRIQGSGAEDLGSFDFSTGKENAPNKKAETRYGYLMNYALTLELDGQQNRGLRGMELLDGSPITFDIQLSGSRNVPAVDTPDFAPLYWSMDGMNNNRTKQDGRYISATNAVPYGRAPFNTGNSTNACYNGGTWTFVQDVSDPNIVHVTVSGYQIDLTHLPCNYFGDTPGNYSVYNPTELGDAYWNLEGKAIFATGEVWVVQPMNTGTNGANGTSMGDAAQADVNVTVSLESSDKGQLTIGNAKYPQMCATDQVAQTTFSTVPSGNVDNRIYYMSIPSGDWEPLTPGQLTGDGDWARIGMPVEIRADLTYDNHLGLDQGAAYDMMIKFDDEFFEPTGGVRYSMPGGFIHGWESTYNSVKTFWATKAGGWNSDDEMKKTGADSTSLTWYSSLDSAKDSGQPIVASLTEFRGLTKELTSHMHVFIQGKVKDTAKPGNVYMVTHDSYVWSIGNLGLTGRDNITLAQINEKIPSQGINRKSYSDYPQWSWRGTGTDDGGAEGAIPTYEKATYENGLFTSHGISSYGGDSCLVLAYTTEITNVVAQTMIEGGKTVEKTTFSLDNGERVVDFKATPGIVLEEVSHSSSGTGTPSENLETVTVTVTLPEGLTYIAGSSYWGGNYAQDPTWKNKGTVSGGIQLEEPTSVSVPVFNAEGKQTGTAMALQWTLENVNVNQGGSLAPIYYSCTIGTPDNFSTDVQKGTNLNVTMRVQSETDKRPTLESNENLKDYSIKVTREEGANVVKTTQTPVVETGTSATFIYDMQVTNSSDNQISNAVVVEGLPYQGDGSKSNFKGTLTLTGFTWNVNGKASQDLTFYYTTDEKFKGASSTSVNADTVKSWSKLDTLPEQGLANVTAIAAVGTLQKQAVLNMTVKLSLSDPKPGEYLVNTISCNSLNSNGPLSDSALSAVASRRLEGLTWLDANKNGRQDSDEDRLPGVTVELYQWVDDEYQLFTVDGKEARIVTGQQMDVSTGIVSDYSGTDAEARYLFTNLPEGTFAVRFSSTEGTVDLSRYAATTHDAPNVDDQYDSDGVPEYDETSNLLTETWIKDINMPDINGIPTGGVYESKYHDSGFYGGNLTITKKIVDDEEYPSDAAKSKTIVVELKAANSETISLLDGKYPYEQTIGKTTTTGTVTFNNKGIARLDGTTNWEFTGDASLVIHGLPVGAEFTVMEYDDANGTNSRIDGYDLTVEISGNVGHAGNKSHKFTGVAIALNELNDDKKIIVDPSVTITNTYKRTAGSLTITKTVSGLADANAITKTYTFTVEAVGDTLKKDVSGKTFDGLTFDDGKATVTIEVNGNASESKTFTGLLTGQYTVTEDSEMAKIPYYVLDVQSEQTLDVKADEKAEFKYTNAYSPSDKNAQLTITKAVSADDNQLSASTTPYTFLVNGTDVYGNAVSERVVVNGSGATQTVLPKGTYTITEATPADVIPGYTWNSVSFQSANRVTVNGAAVTVNLTGEGTVEAAFTATNHYTRDTSSLTIAKEVAGTVSAESVAEKVFKFEVTGPVDANGTYSGVTFENGKAVVEITGASRVTIENLPTGVYTVEEDLDSARVSGRTLSSVTYTDSDEGDDAIPNDGTVTLVKNTDNHVTVVNTYRTPSSPSPDPTPDPRPVPDPDPDPDPRPDPTPDPDPEPEPDDPNVDIPDEDTPLADQPGPDSDVNIPEEEVPLVEIPEEEVPLMEIPDEEVPLANVPKTGDGSGLWYVMALLSGCGLAVLNLLKKREK